MLYTRTPTISLITIYGITLLVLLVIAVVSVVINIIYHRQHVKTKRYYIFSSRLTIEPNDNIMKGKFTYS